MRSLLRFLAVPLFVLIGFALAVTALHALDDPPRTTSADPPKTTPADQSKAITTDPPKLTAVEQTKALQAAIASAKTALDGTSSAHKKAEPLFNLPKADSFTGVNEDTKSRLAGAVDTVVNASNDGSTLVGDLKAAGVSLMTASTALDAEIQKYPDATNLAAAKSLKQSMAQSQTEFEAWWSVEDKPGSLRKAVGNLLAFMETYSAAIEKGLNQTGFNSKDIPTRDEDVKEEDRSVFRERLVNNLGSFARYQSHAVLLQAQMGRLIPIKEKLLKDVGADGMAWVNLTKDVAALTSAFNMALYDTLVEADTKISPADTTAPAPKSGETTESKLKILFHSVQKEFDKEIQYTDAAIGDLRAFKRRTDTVLPILKLNDLLKSSLEAITTQWIPLSRQLRDNDTDHQKALKEFDQFLEETQKRSQTLVEKQVSLRTLMAGDLNKFITEQVRLFYFTDVPRLMLALNQTAHVLNPESKALRDQAAAARTELTQRSGDLDEATQRASELSTRLNQIDADIRSATTNLTQTTNSFRTADSLWTTLTRQSATYKALHPNPADGSAEKEMQARLDDVVSAQKNRRDDAENAKTQADQKKQQLLDEQNGLPAQKAKALQDIETARKEVRRLRRVVEVQAATENQAFIAERDNAPVWIADANTESPDPLQRVILLAYEDSKVLFIRGKPDDVTFAKEIIAQYDRPAPQALITLWTIQMNGSNTRSFNHKLQTIRDEIGNIQVGVTDLQEALRTAVKNEVNRTSDAAEKCAPNSLLRDRLARYFFYTPEMRKQLGFIWPEGKTWTKEFGSKMAAADLRLAIRYLERIQSATYLSKDNPSTYIMSALVESANSSVKRAHLYHQQFENDNKDETGPWKTLNAFLLDSVVVIEERKKNRKKRLGSTSDKLLPDTAASTNGDSTSDKLPAYTIACLIKQLEVQANCYDPPTPASQSENCITKAAVYLAPTEFLTRYTLPDPIKATTLGEMMFAATLANRQSRARIYSDFIANIAFRLASQTRKKSENPLFDFIREAGFRFLPSEDRDYFTYQKQPKNKVNQRLQSLDVIFGDVRNDPQLGDGNEVTPNQMEILLALRTKARSDIAGEVQRLLNQIGKMPHLLQSSDIATPYRDQYLHLVGWLYRSSLPASLDTGPVDWQREGERATDACLPPIQTTDPPRLRDRAAWEIARIQSDLNPLSKATPRVAAADEMIKRLINSFQHDLETLFIRSALKKIDEAGVGDGVELGSIQRTSILATNRLVASVDPVASAQGETSQTDDLLKSAQQLAEFASHFQRQNRAQGLTAGLSAGGAAALTGASAATATGVGLLGALSSLGNESQPAGELYSINTGNLFRITPIFDPSGQALRFRFDFTGTSRITEPDGTRNPLIPRIERHTVNTEVQISNMELREISSFETNTQIGRPERTGGGIPILNRIPILKEIPLIGYFYREAPSPAKRQESLILAQTVIYPTISDIAGLLLESHPQPVSLEPLKPDLVVLNEELINPDKVTLSPDHPRPGDTVTLSIELNSPAPESISFSVTFSEMMQSSPLRLTISRNSSKGIITFNLPNEYPGGNLTVSATPTFAKDIVLSRSVTTQIILDVLNKPANNASASSTDRASQKVQITTMKSDDTLPNVTVSDPQFANLLKIGNPIRSQQGSGNYNLYDIAITPKQLTTEERIIPLTVQDKLGSRQVNVRLVPSITLKLPEMLNKDEIGTGTILLGEASPKERQLIVTVPEKVKNDPNSIDLRSIITFTGNSKNGEVISKDGKLTLVVPANSRTAQFTFKSNSSINLQSVPIVVKEKVTSISDPVELIRKQVEVIAPSKSPNDKKK